MLEKIDPLCIISDHLKTLYDFSTKKPSHKDKFVFFIIPIFISLFIIYFSKGISPDIANILVTSFSIFCGLLLNLLMIIFDNIKKSADETLNAFLGEIFSNISFAILNSIVVIAMVLLLIFVNIEVAKPSISALVIYFVITFLLTLLMILKRVHILFSTEIGTNRS